MIILHEQHRILYTSIQQTLCDKISTVMLKFLRVSHLDIEEVFNMVEKRLKYPVKGYSYLDFLTQLHWYLEYIDKQIRELEDDYEDIANYLEGEECVKDKEEYKETANNFRDLIEMLEEFFDNYTPIR